MTALLALPRDIRLVAAVAAAGFTLLTAAVAWKFGVAAVGLVALAVAGAALLQRPRAAVGGLVALLILAETSAELVPGMDLPYADLPGSLYPVDLLLGLCVAAVGMELLREGRPPRLALGLAVSLGVLALALAVGAAVGTANGASFKDVFFGTRALPYLILVPFLVANVIRSRAQIKLALTALVVLAAVKALLGLLAVAAGRGVDVDGSVITYYEPLANWLALSVLLGIVAALLLRAKLPPPALLVAPLVTASVVLSLRRSFWIGAVFGLALVVILGASPLGRRLLLPTGVLLAGAVYLLAGSGFKVEGPIAERAQSLQPSKVQRNAQDRYRLDERANVIAEIRNNPLTGLGVGVPWSASARALPVERENGRSYVHTVFLWFWLKLGILGALAYLAVIASGLTLAWRTWRSDPDARLRAFGLAAFGSIVALALVETTASFTGVDLRLSALLGAVLGLLSAARSPSLADAP